MPHIDGEQLARMIKSEEHIADTRLVMLTSRGKNTARDLARNGIGACLSKPIRKSELRNTLITVLKNGSADKTEKLDLGLVTRLGPQSSPRPLQGMKILLVDDDPVNCKVATRIIERLGTRPDVADNGLLAVDAVSISTYDLVLMDCQMPEMDGYDATAAIRRNEGPDRHTCIIAMTANAMQGDKERCIAAGMDDYVAKPINQSDLLATIERQLKARQTPLTTWNRPDKDEEIVTG
jgi:two-component system, sensor histidine kinase and response regulator